MQENNYFTYVNGSFYSQNTASLTISDRGLKFGDGVYETIRVENGKPYSWQKHMQRMAHSLELLKIKAKLENLHNVSMDLLQKNNIKSGTLRIMVTRGIGGVGYLPDKNNEFGVVVEANPLPKLPTEPVGLYLSKWRKIPDDCLPSAAKTMQGLSSTLARLEAEENGCFEAILLSLDGHVCEGSSSNIFWVKNGRLFTPSLASGILAGTTRDRIIEIWHDEVIEGIFTLGELETADEVFVTNVAWTALPISKLMPIGINFSSNNICQKVNEIMAQEIATCCA